MAGWKYFIALSTLLCLAAASVTAYQMPEIFHSVAKVRFKTDAPDPSSGTIMSGRMTEAYLASEAQMVRDYGVVGQVVDASGLINNAEAMSSYQQAVPDQSVEFRRWLASQLSNSITLNSNGETTTLDIGFIATSPSDAINVASLIRKTYIEETLARQQFRVQKEAEWFDRQAENIRQRLQLAQTAKAEFERENGIFVSREGVAMDDLRLQSRAQAVALPGKSTSFTPAAAPSSSALAEISAKIEAAKDTLGPNHPSMLALVEQRDVLAQAVERETAAQRAAAPASPPAAAAAPKAEELLPSSPRAESIVEARRMAADIALLEGQYAENKARANDLKLKATDTTLSVEAIGEASVPTKALYPNVPVILALALVFGFAISTLTALLIEFLNLRVWTERDLTASGIPLLNSKSAPQSHLPMAA